MSQHLRYLVTVDAASGAPIKVEQLGQAGDLSEMDVASFLRGLGAASGGASAPPQIVVNIFAGGAPGAGAMVTTNAPSALANPMQNLGIDPAPSPPPVTPPPVTPPPNPPNNPPNKGK